MKKQNQLSLQNPTRYAALQASDSRHRILLQNLEVKTCRDEDRLIYEHDVVIKTTSKTRRRVKLLLRV